MTDWKKNVFDFQIKNWEDGVIIRNASEFSVPWMCQSFSNCYQVETHLSSEMLSGQFGCPQFSTSALPVEILKRESVVF